MSSRRNFARISFFTVALGIALVAFSGAAESGERKKRDILLSEADDVRVGREAAKIVPAQMGLYEDPYDDFGRLSYEMWRALRLVVDTGIHHKRWTREAAIEYMFENTGIPRSEVVTEIERYIVWPGQACAYKVGQLKILELRDRAEERLGDAFDIREFHNVVLTNGALPLSLLERVVDDWLDAADPAGA